VRLIPLCSLFAACGFFGPTQENWPTKASKAACDFQKRCQTVEFWANYEDRDHCEDEQRDLLEDEADLYGDCTFDEDAAVTCLDALGTNCKELGQNFDALLSACYEVWSCNGPRPFDTGTTSF
jgi:hypothetical protein